MSRAGLWVGATAIADTGEFTGVSAAIVDNAQGSSAIAETEFTPAGIAITRLSRISNSRYYSPLALSDLDVVTSYSDRPARNPSGFQRERHTPLNILVKQRVLGFSLDAADAFEVAQFKVVNLGQPLRNTWLGFYVQLASGNRNAYSNWPPTSASGPRSWYYNAKIGWDPVRRLYQERYCGSADYPAGCNFGYCPPVVGVKLLSVTPGDVADKTVGFHWWSYAPGDTARDTDRKRYRILSDGVQEETDGCLSGGGACSPIMVLSVGPFAQIDPGDSIRVDFALVGGDDQEKFVENADFAQFAASIDYHLPSAPPSPLLHIETGDRRVDFYWDDSPESAVDSTSQAPGFHDFEGYRVYLGADRQHPTRVAQFDLADTTGFNTGLERLRLAVPKVIDGVTYRNHFAVDNLRNGFSYYAAVTSYDLGDANVSSLESGLGQNKSLVVPLTNPAERRSKVTVFPNPYRVEARWDQGTFVRDHYLWFANLPRRSLLKIFTLAGDLVYETRFDGASYRGDNARGLYNPREDIDTPPPVLSGSSFAWNLITREGQAIATGLYMFSVEDLEGGPTQRGKFLVVKSDREE